MSRVKVLTEKEKGIVEAFRKALQVAKLIGRCEQELSMLSHGISGGYIEPGASGAITRGKFDILPTGRNFYAVDPRAIPTMAAWKVGVETAEKVLREYYGHHGKYPETIGFILWSIDAYKADGEQLSQILYLLGVKPVWRDDGTIESLEVIPTEELGRPRIDCLVRISGIVRDTLPNYIYLIDEAVEKVALLNEPPETNFVRKHYLEHVEKLKETLRENMVEELAMYRVFCAPPGAYGVGVNLAVEASAWEKDEDLAKVWVQWSGYAYGRKRYGVKAHAALLEALKTVDVVSRNHISDEHDIFNCCCYFAYHGGFYNAAKALSGREVEVIHVDTRDISDTKIVAIKHEIERIVRAKLVNPEWIEEMKKHGYRGASEFSKKILHLYGWSATTRLVDKWVYDKIAEKYALDEDMRRWFEEHNPWALEEIVRRLLEAAKRGLWKPSREMLEKLEEIYSEIEGLMEEMTTVEGEHQGGVIAIYTSQDVQHWNEKLEEVEKLWSAVKKEK